MSAVEQHHSCLNGPDPETGEWPCAPKGYFGVAECQTCGWIGPWAERPGYTTDSETCTSCGLIIVGWLLGCPRENCPLAAPEETKEAGEV